MTSRDETIEAITASLYELDDLTFYDASIATTIYDLHVAPLERERDADHKLIAEAIRVHDDHPCSCDDDLSCDLGDLIEQYEARQRDRLAALDASPKEPS